MSLGEMPWILLSTALCILALIILIRQSGSRVGRLFCGMILLVAIWSMAFAFMLAAGSESRALLWSRVALFAVALLPAAVYDFTATALRLSPRRGTAVSMIWVASAAFSTAAAFTSMLVARVERHPWGFYPRFAMPGGALFLIFFLAVLGAHLAEYVREYRNTTDPLRRHRLRDLIISFCIAYLATIDFLPMLGADRPPSGYIPIAAFVVFAWRSIRTHRLRPITAARAAHEILDTMADALFVLDAEGRIRVVNGAVRKIFGYADWEILGKTIDVLEPIDLESTISRTLRDLLKKGDVRDQERQFRHKEGDLIAVSISLSPVREEEIQQGAVLIARDIRERKRAENELHSYTRKLQQSNRELEDFAYVASHDLQEPLRKIHAFGDRLRDKCGDGLSPEGLDYLQRMQNAARRMQTLINDLLMFSRITTKARPFASVDLGVVAGEVAHDLEARVHETGGTIVLGGLPQIDADPVQMRQLFQNLFGNALKFHRPGVPPRVEVSATTHGESCRIVVCDNGIGFDQKYADRIFAMFERLHGREKYEGTGIGLSICRKIVERHGGEIVATSSPGEGSTFTITLPIRQMKFERTDAA